MFYSKSKKNTGILLNKQPHIAVFGGGDNSSEA